MTPILATVVGARPQLIKASALSDVIERRNDVEEVLIHTGQHFDHNMSGVFFDELGMKPPDRHLGISGGRHGEMTSRMLVALELAFEEVKPDVVLVYGDTNSTLAAALAASKLGIPIAHVEAGLRSYNRAMPEEINRVLTDHMSSWLFTPTTEATTNLETEGIGPESVHQVGDVMLDVALYNSSRADERFEVFADAFGLERGSYVLVTIHRAENTDDDARFRAIVDGLVLAAGEVPIVWPVHPRAAAALERIGRSQESSGMTYLPPQGYLDMMALERAAACIVTDSGGVQKEAFFHRVPCVTVRDETEWVELIDLGWNRLAPPTSAQAVLRSIREGLRSGAGSEATPYGSGRAAEDIAEILGQRV